jgi:hypothetical protein
MSVGSLTTIAAARDDLRQTAPSGSRVSKGAIGRVPAHHVEAGQSAGVADVLAKQLPTELVAPYTALTAVIVGAIASPTPNRPHPDQLIAWRWTAFGVLIASVILLVWFGKQQKTGRWSFPLAAVTSGVVAAVVWACMMPASPISPYLHSEHAQVLVPLFIAVAGVVAAALSASLLVSPTRQRGGGAAQKAAADSSLAPTSR